MMEMNQRMNQSINKIIKIKHDLIREKDRLNNRNLGNIPERLEELNNILEKNRERK